MIDPKEYIESGKLEEYVLGLGSSDLILEVECMARVFPEIKTEINALCTSLEKNALDSAVVPRIDLKTRILNSLDEKPGPVEDKTVLNPPVTGTKGASIPNTFLRLILAVLILTSLLFAFKYFNKSSQLKNNLLESKLRETASLQKMDSLFQISAELQSEINIILNPASVTIRMVGTKLYSTGLAIIYWNSNNQQVYLHPGNLPKTPSDKQYQLWGIVNGKPISLGLLEPSSSKLQPMSSVTNASTFAVTLEPKGGSINPSLDQMYVAGNVALNQ